jgi:Flp pilus assembly protein TadG
MVRKLTKKTRGAAMMELALLSPWVIFLFIGVLDWGFYAYSIITLENAARVAATYASSGNTGSVCTVLLNEMSSLSNMQGVTTCGGSSPVAYSKSDITGPDNNSAISMSVTYTTPTMIPIPGLLAKQFTITRIVKMRSVS